MAFNNIIFTNWSFLCFVFRYSAILIIAAFCGVSICNRTLLRSLLLIVYLYQLLGDAFNTLPCISIFRVFMSIFFFIYFNIQLLIPKLYLNSGTANSPGTVILFLAFNSDFSILLNLQVYSFCNLSFICSCCIT